MALQFIGWLKHHLDRKTFEGCVWVDRSQHIFKILWPRAEKSLTPEKLGVMYKWWTHKFGSTRNQNQPTAIKGNFRSEPTYRYQGKLQVRTNLPLSRETSGQGSIQHARLGMPSTGRFCDDFGPITAKIPLNFQVFFLE